MKRVKLLEAALEERIHALRREYEQPSQEPNTMLSLDALGVHLVAELELLSLLRSHALSESRHCCCGSRLNSSSFLRLSPDSDYYTWTRAAEWKPPNVLVRQINKRMGVVQGAELRGEDLLHWFLTQLLLPIKPRADAHARAELICFHPKKRSDFGEVHFINDLAAVFEACHLGQFALSAENFAYEVNSANWQVTTRNLQRAVLRLRQRQEARGEGRDLILLVWPDEAWSFARGALNAFAPLLFQSTRRQVEVQIVRESKLLSNARRKQTLIALGFSIFANRGLAPFTLKLREEKQMHLAVITSRESRWVCFAWCYSDGQDLGVDCLLHPLSSSSTLLPPARALMDAMRRRINYKNELTVLAFGFPAPHYFAACDKVSEFSADLPESAQMRKELDDLSYLAEIGHFPASGAGEGFVFNTFTPTGTSGGGGGDDAQALPLHLQCAYRLFTSLEGLVPPAPLEYELQFHALRKVTKLFLCEGELKCIFVTERGQVQEVNVEEWITKLSKHHFESLIPGDNEELRIKFTQLWESHYGYHSVRYLR